MPSSIRLIDRPPSYAGTPHKRCLRPSSRYAPGLARHRQGRCCSEAGSELDQQLAISTIARWAELPSDRSFPTNSSNNSYSHFLLLLGMSRNSPLWFVWWFNCPAKPQSRDYRQMPILIPIETRFDVLIAHSGRSLRLDEAPYLIHVEFRYRIFCPPFPPTYRPPSDSRALLSLTEFSLTSLSAQPHVLYRFLQPLEVDVAEQTGRIKKPLCLMNPMSQQ